MKNIRKTITYDHLIAMKPCYTPESIGINEGFEMNIPDFIREFKDKVKSKKDIIWYLCRKQYMSDKDIRLFAVWCAREALKLIENPDTRSINACNIAERYAKGEATDEELRDAKDAAYSAWNATTAYATAYTAAYITTTTTVMAPATYVNRDAQIEQLLTYFN